MTADDRPDDDPADVEIEQCRRRRERYLFREGLPDGSSLTPPLRDRVVSVLAARRRLSDLAEQPTPVRR